MCFTESFESLSAGLQTAVWRLGGAPHAHRTDRLSAAVHQEIHPAVFTRRYQALLAHYRMAGRRIQASQPPENGDIEQRHHRLKEAIDQALLLRGRRDFASRAAYAAFLVQMFDTLNAGRRTRLQAELPQLRSLPPRRLEAWKRVDVRVTGGSLIRVAGNRYSADSRLIGERVQVRVHADELQVWYAQRHVETVPRLRGAGKHRIQYRHLIAWLVGSRGPSSTTGIVTSSFPRHSSGSPTMRYATRSRPRGPVTPIFRSCTCSNGRTTGETDGCMFSSTFRISKRCAQPLVSKPSCTA